VAKPIFCVGHAVYDFIFRLDEMPTRAEKYHAHSLHGVGGGPAATAGVTIAKLGGSVSLAARVGGDALADLIIQELEGYGVDCRYVQRCAGHNSSLSAVMIDAQGERMIVNHLDPSLPNTPAWLPPAEDFGTLFSAVLGDVRWPQGARYALNAARHTGLPAVLDADRGIANAPELLQAASHIAFSRDGLADLTGLQDPRAGLLAVRDRCAPWLCVTLGAQGVLSLESDGQFIEHAPYRVVAVDTLGSGDVWHGAFVYQLAQGASTHAAIHYAQAAAAFKTTRAGGRAGAPSAKELETFLQEHQA
jgi:sulfofructose kinase